MTWHPELLSSLNKQTSYAIVYFFTVGQNTLSTVFVQSTKHQLMIINTLGGLCIYYRPERFCLVNNQFSPMHLVLRQCLSTICTPIIFIHARKYVP